MDKVLDTRIDESVEPMTAIFGLRFLEEEAAEIHDVVGCLIRQETEEGPGLSFTGCDDYD